MPPAVRIKAASRQLDVPVPTLRRWTQEFAAGLSPDARASEGRPRQFTARDMRVLRRAKEILSDKELTYERARKTLAGEGLLAYEAEAEATADGAQARDAAAEREAAERFVRDVVQRAVAPVLETNAQLAARIAELERHMQELHDQLEGGRGDATEAERRRGWFR